MKKDAGFTLIEVIVTLVLLGIMGALAGMLIATGVQGYISVNANNELSQKAQLALDRMILEFEDISNISAISTVTPDYICYTLRYYDVPTDSTIDVNRCIGLVGSQIKIVAGAAPPAAGTGSVLIDNVNAFQLNFYSITTDAFTGTFTGNGSWVPASTISDLASIKIVLTLNRTDLAGATYTCSTLYDVRRNGRIGMDDMPIYWNKD